MTPREQYLLMLVDQHTHTLAHCELRVADWITGVSMRYPLNLNGFTVEMTVTGTKETYTATGECESIDGVDVGILQEQATANALISIFVARWEAGHAPVQALDDAGFDKHMELIDSAPTLWAAAQSLASE